MDKPQAFALQVTIVVIDVESGEPAGLCGMVVGPAVPDYDKVHLTGNELVKMMQQDVQVLYPQAHGARIEMTDGVTTHTHLPPIRPADGPGSAH